MSYTITTDIFCDKCNDWTAGVTSNRVQVTEAREVARRSGWTCPKKKSEFQRDLCPRCYGTSDYKPSDGSYLFKEKQ